MGVNSLCTCSCRCSSVRNVAGAWQFSGISFSRFVNYWRNHGKTAIADVPSSAMSYLTTNARSGQASGIANGVKRARRHSYDSSKAEEVSRSVEHAGSEVAVKELPSPGTSESSDVISSSRRELRRDRAASATSSHAGPQRRQTDAARMDNAPGTRRRRCVGLSDVSAIRNPSGWRTRGNALGSRRTPLASGATGLPGPKGIAVKCIRRLRGE